jgi:hypothetical protein
VTGCRSTDVEDDSVISFEPASITGVTVAVPA